MEEKPKVKRNSRNVRGRGFYVAMYSSLGGLLVLAVAIGYYNFIGFGGSSVETYVTEMSQEDLWQAEADHHPVGNNLDEPIASRPGGQPTQTPPASPQGQTPAPRPSQDEDAGSGQPERSPAPSSSPPAGRATPAPRTEPSQSPRPEGADDDWDWDWEISGPVQDEIYLDEEYSYDDDDAHQVLDTAQAPQTFAHFTEDDDMHWPVLGDVVMDFAMDKLVYDITLDQWRTNDNVAIAANRGDAVRAAASGVVSNILESRQFGPTVVIDHGNGWVTTYSQLDPDTAVSVGDVVTRGQIIGSVGSPSIFGSLLGYHVNFAITSDNTPINPHTLLTTAE